MKTILTIAAQTILNALHDVGVDFEGREEQARDAVDGRGDWLYQQAKEDAL